MTYLTKVKNEYFYLMLEKDKKLKNPFIIFLKGTLMKHFSYRKIFCLFVRKFLRKLCYDLKN